MHATLFLLLLTVSSSLALFGDPNFARFGNNFSFRSNPFGCVTPGKYVAKCTRTLGSFNFDQGCRQGRNAAITYVVSPKSTVVLPSTSFASFTTALPQRRQCATGSCQYYYNCKSRSSSTPNHFCMMDNGFTGICCPQQSQSASSKVTQLIDPTDLLIG